MPIDAFIAYAHADEAHLDALHKHLALLRREDRIRAWHDREITGGDVRRERIDSAFERAALIFLLISPDFMASDDCWQIVGRALERVVTGVHLVPILVRPTDWTSSPLGELQALPQDARPITTWPDRDEAWLDVVQGLRRVLDELARRSSESGISERLHRDGSALVHVPAGTYPIGTSDLDPASGPPRTIDLAAFWIGKHPVTNAQFRAFLGDVPGPEPRYWSDPRFAGDEQPAVGITWDEAAAYCRWAGAVLPPESWWEAAARGPAGRRYPWGDGEPTAERAVFEGAGTPAAPAAIGGRPAGAGPFGSHDQAGNVGEWCADPWGEPSLAHGNFRVVRGGAWNDPGWKLRAARRTWSAAEERRPDIGFRIALKASLSGRSLSSPTL